MNKPQPQSDSKTFDSLKKSIKTQKENNVRKISRRKPWYKSSYAMIVASFVIIFHINSRIDDINNRIYPINSDPSGQIKITLKKHYEFNLSLN